MHRHTYSLLMALIRLGKGALSACESWVVQEWKGSSGEPLPEPHGNNTKASEGD